jgi:hypothetical protein
MAPLRNRGATTSSRQSTPNFPDCRQPHALCTGCRRPACTPVQPQVLSLPRLPLAGVQRQRTGTVLARCRQLHAVPDPEGMAQEGQGVQVCPTGTYTSATSRRRNLLKIKAQPACAFL